MTPPDPTAGAGDAPRSPELEDRDLERLRAAGAGARLAAGVGCIGLGLLTLQLLDFAVKAPGSPDWFAHQPATTTFSRVLSFIESAAGLILVGAFGRNVLAHFRGAEGALARAFRSLRFFFVLWTCGTAATVLSLLAAIWSRF